MHPPAEKAAYAPDIGVFKTESAKHNRTPEYQSEMERNKLNLQTVLFRPLRSHQCHSEWFENWDMSWICHMSYIYALDAVRNKKELLRIYLVMMIC